MRGELERFSRENPDTVRWILTGLNVGAVAGAGVPGHLHWHLVPRWPGDVNFMPSVAGVKVLPQSLDALWQQLRGAEPPRP